MFDTFTDRIAGAVLTGIDVAVEFATLGEYRLALDPETAAGTRTEAHVPQIPTLSGPSDRSLLPQPSSAAGRLVTGTPAPVVTPGCSEPRRRPAAKPKPRRKRAGQLKSPNQLCLAV